jgi:hypothetical protein
MAGPRAKDIKKLKKVHERLGNDTLIVFINARASIAAAVGQAKKGDSADLESNWVDEVFTSG